MKKILLLLTGGTIGSFEENGVISVKTGKCRVAEIYQENNPNCNLDFVIKEPYNILSENLTVQNWETIIRFILSYDLTGFDGIIITHGSDTLSYSSAMLGMCLHGLGIPVVITASDYVPDDSRSNALVNFSAAVNLIRQIKNGVYTVYKNLHEHHAEIFIPTRLKEADRINDCFLTINNLPAASIDESGNIRECNNIVGLSALENRSRFFDTDTFRFPRKVMLIHPYPSINYNNMTVNDSIGAVLHVTYHSGTVSEQAIELLKQCRKKDIPLFLCSLKSNTKALYETSNILLQQGALPLYDIGTESAYAKLLLAVNLFPDNIAGLMKKDIYFENLSFTQ